MRRASARRHSRTMTPCNSRGCAGLCTDDGLAQAHRDYAARMYSRAVRIVVDPHLAEEAVQEAFVRAWRRCGSFDPALGRTGAWLVAITANVSVDLVRARARRPPVAPVEDSDAAVASAAATTDRALEQVLLRDQLSGALKTIGAEQRMAVVETILRDRSYADVAGELGLPAATIRTRVHYGLKRLRTALAEDLDDYREPELAVAG
jgi:RNA polymerase sigma-70 factor, ECF subfamily